MVNQIYQWFKEFGVAELGFPQAVSEPEEDYRRCAKNHISLGVRQRVGIPILPSLYIAP